MKNFIRDKIKSPKMQAHKGLVSIIITSYNSRKFIYKAINSALNQTYKNIEILIIDDNSTDRTLNELLKYVNNPKIHIYKSPMNVGPYVLKNYLIDKLRGEFVTILDADDVDEPNRIQKQIDEFKNNSNLKCVTCSYSRDDKDASFGWPNMMFKKEVFDKIGYYDSVRFGADSEFYYRFKKYYKDKNVEKHIPLILTKGPRRQESLTNINPENSNIRKEYHELYTKWQNTTDKLWMPFDSSKRPFPVSNRLLNKELPPLSSIEKIEKKGDVLPIVMCVWKRIEGFEMTIIQFNNQTYKNFKLFIWNNNSDPSYVAKFNSLLSEKAEFDWQIYHSTENIGGFGRFYFAKKLRRIPGLSNWVVFIDDDQRWGPNMLATMWSERAEKTILSQFGWRFDGKDYYRNRVAASPGEKIHYAGTGGMIVHNPVFDDPFLFITHPEDWWVEDLWLSYWANHIHGYNVLKSAAEIKNGDDEHSLYKRVKDTKTPMLQRLLDKGNWNILSKNTIKPLLNKPTISKKHKPTISKKSKFALIVPFKNNEEDYLRKFVPYMQNFLGTKHDYEIVVVEQCDNRPINKAKLMNIGFNIMKQKYDFFCFHDVNLLPKKNSNYSEVKCPTHLVSKINFKDLTFSENRVFNGVSMFSKKDFIKVNGFSNIFQGNTYGKEMLERCIIENCRVEKRWNEYRNISKSKEYEIDENFNILDNFKQDGLNSLKYKILSKTRYVSPNYTLVKVQI